MARIRSIKPEFPQSETIGKLSRDARLLFIQLWTVVDDEGRTRAASRMLASLLYPYDDDAREQIDGWLDELEQQHCIRRYDLDGSSYLEIVNWLKHQKIDRPSKSRLPSFDEGSPKAREDSRSLDADLGPRTSTKDLGRDKDHSRAVAGATRTHSDARFDEFWEAYPKREGANPKEPSRKKFAALVKSGIDPGLLIEAARNFATDVRSRSEENTKFVAMASTWLNQRRDLDYLAGPPGGGMSEAERQKLFAELRGSNERKTEKDSDLRRAGNGACQIERDGREEPTSAPDDQTRYTGMGGVA